MCLCDVPELSGGWPLPRQRTHTVHGTFPDPWYPASGRHGTRPSAGPRHLGHMGPGLRPGPIDGTRPPAGPRHLGYMGPGLRPVPGTWDTWNTDNFFCARCLQNKSLICLLRNLKKILLHFVMTAVYGKLGAGVLFCVCFYRVANRATVDVFAAGPVSHV